MERELREELVVIEPKRKLRYVFTWGDGTLEDRAEFALARRVWGHAHPDQDIAGFEPRPLPLKWLDGPDTLSVGIGTEPAVDIGGCWLNINASDFGIELDKVVWINVDPDAILVDGEMFDDTVLDRPVGLFDVDRMDRLMRSGESRFIPDIYFHHGVRRLGSGFEKDITTAFTNSLRKEKVRTPAEISYFKKLARKFDLCPVTRAILVRAAGLTKQATATKASTDASRKPEIFISCGHGDEALARRIYNFVTTEKRKSAFFYEEDQRSVWGRGIDDALCSANCLIVAGTDPRRMNRPWPKYEWGSFKDAILNRRKPRTAKLIPFVVGIKPERIPWALQGHKAVVCTDIPSGLHELDRLL
jgi:hypothetical protein